MQGFQIKAKQVPAGLDTSTATSGTQAGASAHPGGAVQAMKNAFMSTRKRDVRFSSEATERVRSEWARAHDAFVGIYYMARDSATILIKAEEALQAKLTIPEPPSIPRSGGATDTASRRSNQLWRDYETKKRQRTSQDYTDRINATRSLLERDRKALADLCAMLYPWEAYIEHVDGLEYIYTRCARRDHRMTMLKSLRDADPENMHAVLLATMLRAYNALFDALALTPDLRLSVLLQPDQPLQRVSMASDDGTAIRDPLKRTMTSQDLSASAPGRLFLSNQQSDPSIWDEYLDRHYLLHSSGKPQGVHSSVYDRIPGVRAPSRTALIELAEIISSILAHKQQIGLKLRTLLQSFFAATTRTQWAQNWDRFEAAHQPHQRTRFALERLRELPAAELHHLPPFVDTQEGT